MVHYEKYRDMPLDRIDIFRNLIQLRMTYHDGGFYSHLDVLNKIVHGKCFDEAGTEERRRMFSVWNLPSFNGMLSMSQLVAGGFNCKVINNFDAEIDLLERYCRASSRPIIGISSTFILQWSEVGRIAKVIRRIAPNAVIVLGGAFVNDVFVREGKAAFERYLRQYRMDYVVYSFNSENDLLALLQALKKGAGIGAVNNLAYLDADGRFQTTAEVWNEPNVSYPPQAWKNLYSPENMGQTLQLRTTSGCPFSCAFCTYPVTAGGFFSADVSDFERQLEAIDSIGGIDSLILIDDTPNVPLNRFRVLVDVFKRHRFRWYSFLRVQYMDEQLAKDMAESGCDGVYLGIESANDEVLTAMNKKARVKDYRNGIDMLKRNGITVFAAFVIGFPGETRQSIDDNIEFIEESGLDFYSLKEFYYTHTAPIHHDREKWGLTGDGNKWQHKTMSSEEASEHKLRIFETVKRSVNIDSDSGLWYLAYLRECGFNWREISEMQILLNEMMHRDNRGEFLGKGRLIGGLAEILDRADFKAKPKEFAARPA